MAEKLREVEQRLKEVEEEASYYRRISEESGRKRLREVDQLSRLIAERQRAQEEKAKLEAQLQQTRKMETIGTMAAGVAHDLNNVLSGIVSYPDLLLMQLPPDSPLRNPILAIKNSGKKAAAIVQDMLTLARRGAMLYEPVNLNDIVSEYLQSPEYKKLLSFHPGVEMETCLDPDLLNLQGSSIHLSKTVMNLVSNAAEAMPERGRILITTRNHYVDKPNECDSHDIQGDCVLLSVSDTGVGMTAQDKEKIFDPFYSKKKLGRSGTGLGMTVVWGTVKDHKGAIEMKSSPEKGTTFTLMFPATKQKKAQSTADCQMDTLMGKGESILVVDDVREQREIASGLLTRLNYFVTAALSGEDAVEYLKDHTADLVILDMIMDPGMDGLETYRQILKIHPEQKAIVSSGFTESDRVQEAQRLGAEHYLKKPYTVEQIGKAVKAALEPED